MALVTTATTAVVLGAGNDQLEIYLRGDRSRQPLPETGPTRAAIELGSGRKQGLIAAGAMEGARPLLVVERACKRWLCPFLTQHPIGLRGEAPFPFGIAEIPGTVLRFRGRQNLLWSPEHANGSGESTHQEGATAEQPVLKSWRHQMTTPRSKHLF